MFGAWFRRMVREAMSEPVQSPSYPTERAMMDSAPAIVAFRITNGFVVRCHDQNERIGAIAPGFTYCKDAQQIAEHIVASAMRDKLGVQSDMFEKERTAAMAQVRYGAATKSNVPF